MPKSRVVIYSKPQNLSAKIVTVLPTTIRRLTVTLVAVELGVGLSAVELGVGLIVEGLGVGALTTSATASSTVVSATI